MKKNLYAIFTGIYCSSLIISNILAFKTFCIGNIDLPSAVIIFPIIYIINDILSEIYGYKKAKTTILLGFLTNLIAVIMYNIAIILPSAPTFIMQNEFSIVLSNSFRMLVASFLAYIIGALANSKIMIILKEKANKKLMLRCVLSTLVGETIDACIFITIAFAFTMPFKTLVTMIIAQALFKTVYEIAMYPITKKIIQNVKIIEEIN